MSVPYWNVNIPEQEHTEQCPEFLRNLTAREEATLSTPEDSFQIMMWGDILATVKSNRLDLLRRTPLSFRKYLAFMWDLKKRHGDAETFILEERLGWTRPVKAAGAPFEREDQDIKVLQNDWPYGVDRRAVHLVVWTKFSLADPEDEDGPVLGEEYSAIDAYVTRKFRSRMAADKVTWFKNWGTLKSVDGVEHFHVMLLDPDPAFVREVTNGVVPLYLQPRS